MKKQALIAIMVATLVVTFIPTLSFATDCNDETISSTENEEVYEISSLQELEKEIEMADEDNKVSNREAKEILSEVEPDVMMEYVGEIDDIVSEAVENGQPDEEYYDAECDKTTEIYEIEIDGLSSAKLELVDQEEKTPVETVVSKIKEGICPSVFAATNGEEKWKDYGNRYFTAKYTRCIGPGYCIIKTENHYKVGSSGITERYGDSWIADSTSIFTNVSGPTDKITKKSATSAGSYAHMKTSLRVTMSVEGVVRTYDIAERTGIKYIKKDSSKKRIKVEHYWKKLY